MTLLLTVLPANAQLTIMTQMGAIIVGMGIPFTLLKNVMIQLILNAQRVAFALTEEEKAMEFALIVEIIS